MVGAGIDLGAQTVKVAVMSESQLLGYSIAPVGFDALEVVYEGMDEAVKRAGVTRADIKRIVATGVGRADIPFADDTITEMTCDAKGANWVFPSARTVIDIGAEESRGVKCYGGSVMGFAKNDKCAAGVGSFVESMSRALEVTVSQLGELALQSTQKIEMNVMCVVFAESEVVSLIHSNILKADIARAITDAIAARTVSMVRRVGVEEDVALIGGVAYNVGVVNSLKRELGVDLLIPEQPQIIGAIGAALWAIA
ncbi:MAG: CoA activase [Chloroflexi bacterium]|nr:CoA activase [Chloroflexota bacterium]